MSRLAATAAVRVARDESGTARRRRRERTQPIRQRREPVAPAAKPCEAQVGPLRQGFDCVAGDVEGSQLRQERDRLAEGAGEAVGGQRERGEGLEAGEVRRERREGVAGGGEGFEL